MKATNFFQLKCLSLNKAAESTGLEMRIVSQNKNKTENFNFMILFI